MSNLATSWFLSPPPILDLSIVILPSFLTVKAAIALNNKQNPFGLLIWAQPWDLSSSSYDSLFLKFKLQLSIPQVVLHLPSSATHRRLGISSLRQSPSRKECQEFHSPWLSNCYINPSTLSFSCWMIGTYTPGRVNSPPPPPPATQRLPNSASTSHLSGQAVWRPRFQSQLHTLWTNPHPHSFLLILPLHDRSSVRSTFSKMNKMKSEVTSCMKSLFTDVTTMWEENRFLAVPMQGRLSSQLLRPWWLLLETTEPMINWLTIDREQLDFHLDIEHVTFMSALASSSLQRLGI